jgi:Ser/Thr protein kinase RdoA (MazF antagonist)
MTEISTTTGAGNFMSATWEQTSLSDAATAVFDIYGVSGTAKRLSSERDETFLFTRDDGAEFVLKIANPVENPAALDFQDGVLMHLASVAPSVPVPRLVQTTEGEASHSLSTPDGPRIVRLLTFLRGELQYRTQASKEQSRNVGRTLAQLGRGLESCQSRPPAGKLMWDISHTLDLADVIDYVAPERRMQVEAVLAEFERAAATMSELNRRQIIHNDFNPHNILLDPASPDEVVGIIDFGDMVYAPVVNDLAVALSYHLATENWVARTGAFLEGFLSERTLEPVEMELLPILTRSRLAMSIIIGEWRSALFPENADYIMRNHASVWQGLLNISDLTSAGLKNLVPNFLKA